MTINVDAGFTSFSKGDRGSWLPDAQRWEPCNGKIWQCSANLSLVSYQLTRIPGKEYWRLGKGNPTHFNELSPSGDEGFDVLGRLNVVLPGGYIITSEHDDCEYLPPDGIAIEYIEVSEKCRKMGIAATLLDYIINIYKPFSVLVFPNSKASANLFSKVFDATLPDAYDTLPTGPCGWSGGKPIRMEMAITPALDVGI